MIKKDKQTLQEFYDFLREKTYNQLQFELKEKKKPKSIYSAVHKEYVIFDTKELSILDSFFIQRLREISHLGLAHLVFPESKHSRYDHSIGAFYLAKEVIKYLQQKGISVDDEIIKNLPMAALLHDIGHYPFSHVSEIALGLNHKLRSARIVLGKDEVINRIWREHHRGNEYKLLKEFLEKNGYNPELIAHWISPYDIPLETKELKTFENFSFISGPLDVDSLDYLPRDAFFTGTPYGSVDVKRMLTAFSLETEPTTGRKILAIEEKALDSVIHFLLGNEMSFNAIACHHTVRIAEAMLKTALLHAADLMEEEELRDFILHLGIMDDDDLYRALEIISKEREDGGIIKTLLQGLQYRRLFKSIEIGSTRKGVDNAIRSLCESVSPLVSNPYMDVPERLTLYLTKRDMNKWPFVGDLVIIDAKHMPALYEAYVDYVLEKLDGRGRKNPLYILRRENNIRTRLIPLTEISAKQINPQNLLASYIALTASILCIGIEEDRENGNLEIFRDEGYEYLSRFLYAASLKQTKILNKINIALRMAN